MRTLKILLLVLIASTCFAQRHRHITSGSAPPQQLRPASDVLLYNWYSTESNWWSAIEYADSKHITGEIGYPNVLIVGLSAGTDPGVNTGHKLHIKITTMGAGDFSGSAYLIDATNGTIFTIDLTTLSAGDNVVDLDETSAGNITAYSTLTLALAAYSAGVAWVIDEVYLEVPAP